MTRNFTFITRERAELRGCSSHVVDSGMAHSWKRSIEDSLYHVRCQKAQNWWHKRGKVMGIKFSQTFWRIPTSDQKGSGKKPQPFIWRKSYLMRNLLLSHCHSLTSQTFHVTTTATLMLHIQNLRFLGQLSMEMFFNWATCHILLFLSDADCDHCQNPCLLVDLLHSSVA